MKIRFWYVVVFCFLVSVIAYRAFVDFRQRSDQTTDFEFLIRDAPLPIRCLFLDPNRLKVKAWHTGDYSLYQWKSNFREKTISVQVAAEMDNGGEKLHWVKINGIKQFNHQIEVENWKLVNQRSFQRKNEIQSFSFIAGFIPIINGFRIDSIYSPTIELEKIGNELLKTHGGDFQCTNYLVSMVSNDGARRPFLELWVNTDVRPLGIVRARWRDEFIEIIEVVPNRSVESSEIVKTQLNRKNAIRNQSCTQCHVDEIGGKDVNLVGSGYAVAGDSFDFTDVHFHAFQAGLTTMKNPIHLRTVSKNKRLANEVVRFTWEKGSFSAKSDRYGDLYLSMDPVLHQAHLRAIPDQGRLAISFYNTPVKKNRILKWLATVESGKLPR